MKRFVSPSPGSRSRRADHHDYRGGAYFVTTNTKRRVSLFGTVERGRMYLSDFGKIVAEEWKRTGELRDEVSVDAFVVMPDHVHGLLWIRHSDGESERQENREGHRFRNEKPESESREVRQSRNGTTEMTRSEGRTPLGEESRDASRDSSRLPPGLQKRRAGTLSTIIGCFKAAVTRRINEQRETPGESVWQSSFHDHIVQNRDELRRIRHYIRTNPQKWSSSD